MSKSLANSIKVGADPEFFLWNTKRDRYESAHNLIPGTKKDPHKVKCGAIQVDGTAVEFNIDPASSPEEFATNIETVLKELRGIIPKEYKFVFKSDIDYEPEYFKSLPDACLELGCDPDFNSFYKKRNPQPKPIGTMRTGSGHIHVGWTSGASIEDKSHMSDCEAIVTSLDQYFYAYLQVLDPNSRRSKMYGGRGAFRYKPYGCEYRTPSNVWLNYPAIWPWIFQSVKYVIEESEKGKPIYTQYSIEDVLARKRSGDDALAGLAATTGLINWQVKSYPVFPKFSTKNAISL